MASSLTYAGERFEAETNRLPPHTHSTPGLSLALAAFVRPIVVLFGPPTRSSI